MAQAVTNDPAPEDLQAVLAAKSAELHDLATMGAVITSIQEIDAVLSVVMDMAVRLVDGEVGLIMLADDEDALHLKISWGINEEFVRGLMYGDDMDLPTYCHTRGESVILTDLNIREENGILIDSIICVPISTAKRRHGVQLIINKAAGGNFTDDDRERMEMLLNFVAVAIDNSRLVQEQLRRQKIEQEMAIARQVQETILPQDINSIPEVEVGTAYFPAREVGGDFYDLQKLSDAEFIVMIGDVSNKGVPAALVMSAAAGIIKSTLTDTPSIPVNQLAGRLNDILCRDIIKHREMFITIFFARFDLSRNELTYCNAGHLPGLLWSNERQEIVELSDGGPIIGQFAGVPFALGSYRPASGDRLFLFTDGLTEAEDADRRLFGRERAEQVFSTEIDQSPTEFCATVKEWVDRFTRGAAEDSRDDFTILQVRIK